MNKRGFTLLELLVVVLIIGILTAIALPQYKMAVTKAKVASILPLMRRFKDAQEEYQLRHGDHCKEHGGLHGECITYPDGSELGVNWPSDWKDMEGEPCGDSIECKNDYWDICGATGQVFCARGDIAIYMYYSDHSTEKYRDKVTCYSDTPEGVKICKVVGSKLLDGDDNEAEYQL